MTTTSKRVWLLHIRRGGYQESGFKWLLIYVGDANRIKEEVSLKWKNRSFRIWVEEELDDWVPDCLGVPFSPSSEGFPSMSSQPEEEAPVSGVDGSEKPREEVEEVGEIQKPVGIGDDTHATDTCIQEEREYFGCNDEGGSPRFVEGTTVDYVNVGPNMEKNDSVGPAPFGT
ncbi:hypothetical protein Hanom_Chr07g00593621 [Helianthus anomalus]